MATATCGPKSSLQNASLTHFVLPTKTETRVPMYRLVPAECRFGIQFRLQFMFLCCDKQLEVVCIDHISSFHCRSLICVRGC